MRQTKQNIGSSLTAIPDAKVSKKKQDKYITPVLNVDEEPA